MSALFLVAVMFIIACLAAQIFLIKSVQRLPAKVASAPQRQSERLFFE